MTTDTNYTTLPQLLHAADADDDLLLDVVEGVLVLTRGIDQVKPWRIKLDEVILDLGGSAYTVSDAGLLVDRVSTGMQSVHDAAVAPGDGAAEELETAWAAAYGREPNPSDAWDHAIKAVETILQPVVQPTHAKATLGTILALLNSQGSLWEGVLPGAKDDYDVSNVVQVLRLMWPNPDRHGPVRRTPTLTETRAVVALAASIVQWQREGYVVRKR